MNSNLQNKLQQFNAEPPEGVWNKIADALDAETFTTEENFPKRLYQYEEAPPAAVWQEIEKGFEVPAPAKVVPFTFRFRKPLRYAAVACFIAVVMVTITLSVKRTEAGAIDPASNTTVPANNTAATPDYKSTEEEKNSPVQTTSTQQQNKNGETTTAEQKNRDAVLSRKENAIVSANRSGKEKTNGSKNATAAYASLNEYVFFSDGDGKVRKISKKLARFVNCKEDDGNCKQRLQQLRQKLASRAMTSDFTGILEMLRQLQ